MTERDQSGDNERLPEETARRLLARASELEASRVAELSVAELRDVARQAGIAPRAFDEALAELRARDLAPTATRESSRLRLLNRLWPVVVSVVGLLVILFIRAIFPPG
jgi:hypothetical protein